MRWEETALSMPRARDGVKEQVEHLLAARRKQRATLSSNQALIAPHRTSMYSPFLRAKQSSLPRWPRTKAPPQVMAGTAITNIRRPASRQVALLPMEQVARLLQKATTTATTTTITATVRTPTATSRDTG